MKSQTSPARGKSPTRGSSSKKMEGFLNLGNTCYIGSFLSSIQSLPFFLRDVASSDLYSLHSEAHPVVFKSPPELSLDGDHAEASDQEGPTNNRKRPKSPSGAKSPPRTRSRRAVNYQEDSDSDTPASRSRASCTSKATTASPSKRPTIDDVLLNYGVRRSPRSSPVRSPIPFSKSDPEEFDCRACVYCALKAIAEHRMHPSHGVTNPDVLKRAVALFDNRFLNTDQQDCHEFMVTTLDRVSEDLRKGLSEEEKKRSDAILKDKDPVQLHFGGEMENRLKCVGCTTTSTAKEKFTHMSVDFPPDEDAEGITSVQDLLDSYFKEHTRELYCETKGCGATSVTSAYRMTSLPRVLILHVKRFQPVINKKSGEFVSYKKRAERVTISPTLDLRPYLSPSLLTTATTTSTTTTPTSPTTPITTSACSSSPKSELATTEINHPIEPNSPNISLVENSGGSEEQPQAKMVVLPRRSARLQKTGPAPEPLPLPPTRAPRGTKKTATAQKKSDLATSPATPIESPLAAAQASNSGEQDPKSEYKLLAVISHKGTSASAGHYTCDVQNFKTKTWSCYDDSNVFEVSEETVLGTARQKMCYIFFFVRGDVIPEFLG